MTILESGHVYDIAARLTSVSNSAQYEPQAIAMLADKLFVNANKASGVGDMAGKRTTKRKDPAVTRSGAAKDMTLGASEDSAASADATVPFAGQSVTVTLPADCRIAAQGVVKADLLSMLPADRVLLDGRLVDRVDTAGLQLLTLFRRQLNACGGDLQWLGASDVLNEAAGLLGLSQQLNLPAAALV